MRNENVQSAVVEFVATIFILMAWFLGVTALSGPVMMLVVIPIERMVRLLGMLMVDPLGYQDTLRFKKFRKEEEASDIMCIQNNLVDNREGKYRVGASCRQVLSECRHDST